MQMKLYLTTIVCLVFLSGNLFANNQVIHVNQHKPQFSITLDANHTTGYAWSLKHYDKKLISLVNHKYIRPHSTLIGAPGYEKWTFEAKPSFFKHSTTTIVSLDYARSWEHGKSIKTAVYKIMYIKK